MAKKSVLGYLKENLDPGFMTQYKELSAEDKEWYKNAAKVEMAALGIEIDEPRPAA